MALDKRYHRLRLASSIILIIFFAIRIGFGQNYWVQVVNKTAYYIHVIINDHSYLYIKPDGHFKDSFESQDIHIKVLYSPGQAITGRISRQFRGHTDSDIICDKGLFCNEEPPLSVNWFVTPDDFMGSDTMSVKAE